MDKYDQLEKIKRLLDEGAMTQEEYELEKDRLLHKSSTDSSQFWGMEENTYCMFMHLAQFAGFVFPFAGLILPIVMWATAKDHSKNVDAHGRIIFNWMVSMVIYWVITIILMFVFIGFLIMPILILVSFIFIVLGAVKANSGEVWDYPLSIAFFGRGEDLRAELD